MRENIKATVKNILTAYLELNKHRKTPERFTILDAVYSMDGHFSLEELGDKLTNEYKRPTVFFGRSVVCIFTGEENEQDLSVISRCPQCRCWKAPPEFR